MHFLKYVGSALAWMLILACALGMALMHNFSPHLELEYFGSLVTIFTNIVMVFRQHDRSCEKFLNRGGWLTNQSAGTVTTAWAFIRRYYKLEGAITAHLLTKLLGALEYLSIFDRKIQTVKGLGWPEALVQMNCPMTLSIGTCPSFSRMMETIPVSCYCISRSKCNCAGNCQAV